MNTAWHPSGVGDPDPPDHPDRPDPPDGSDGSDGPENPDDVARRALVLTASNRAAAGVYADTVGPLLLDALVDLGFDVDGPVVVPDGEPVHEALRRAVKAAYDVIITTGGTGISPTDRTPEMTRRVLDYEVPGIPEAIRAAGQATVASAALSRGVAGVAGRTLVVNLPGSAGGARDGMAVLRPLLHHAVDQLHGGDHLP